MKSAIISSLALANIAAAVAGPCFVSSVTTELGATEILIADLVAFNGALLTIAGVIDGTGTAVTPLPTFTGASGSLTFVDNKVTVVTPGEGSITPGTADPCTSISFNDPTHKYATYWYKSTNAVDFFQSAVTMAGGSVSSGEYFLDGSNNPIHLRQDATATKDPEENWFVVSSAIPAPAVNLATNVPTIVNTEYKEYLAGDVMINTDDLAVLKTQYGSNVFDFTFWVNSPIPESQAPKVDATGAYPHGMAKIAAKGADDFTLSMVDAETPAFVLASAVLVAPVTTPEPTPLPTVVDSTASPNFSTTDDSATTSSAMSQALVIGVSTIFGLFLL